MKPYPTIRSFALAALLAISLPPSPSEAVSISLVPDGSTTIAIGETVNVDVFMVLDAADQVAGIGAATLHLELGSGFVDVVGSSSGSVFPVAVVNVYAPKDFIAFSQYGVAVTSPTALLGSLSITGRAPGSYDLRAIRFGNFPLFTAPGSSMNRYVFTPDQALRITVTCAGDGCASTDLGPPPPVTPISSPDESPAAPVIPKVDVGEVTSTESGGQVNLYMKTTLTTFATTDTGSFANTAFNTLTSTTQVVPEPNTFALLGLALAGLMLLRNPRRERSKRSPGS